MTTITLDTATLAQAAAKTGRTLRKPTHDFHLKTVPWGIQPFMIAPVLPGETMKNALIQARVVTDPVKAPLQGWWTEFYLFYVKLRDLDKRDELTNMLLTPGYNIDPLRYSGTHDYPKWDINVGHHGYGSHDINYPRMCLDRVVAEYFRDEGDNPTNFMRGGLEPGIPPATINVREYWHQSAKLESAVPQSQKDYLPGEKLLPDDQIPAGFEQHYAQWQHMRALEMTTVTFEDWLAQFGVRTPKLADPEENHRPELLRYVRDWSYPSNTINPETGEPTSALSWSIAERADKDRFFREPGFVFGVTVTRPKIYLGRQYKPAVSMLNDAFAWLPALMSADPYTSLKRFGADEGPLANSGSSKPQEAYWVDVRDLFLYGDSMHNWRHDDGSTDTPDSVNMIFTPKPDLTRRYADEAMADALFKYAEKKRVHIDGVCNLQILGNQRDHT